MAHFLSGSLKLNFPGLLGSTCDETDFKLPLAGSNLNGAQVDFMTGGILGNNTKNDKEAWATLGKGYLYSQFLSR